MGVPHGLGGQPACLSPRGSRPAISPLPFLWLGANPWDGSVLLSEGDTHRGGRGLGDGAVSRGLKQDLGSRPRKWAWAAWMKTRNPSC